MDNFNTTRFINFGKYDLAINKKFYRNTSLLTVLLALGIATLGFFIRWGIAKSCDAPIEQMVQWIDTPDGILSSFFTSVMLLVFASTMYTIISGHTFHNLRNKQGRITELTIPATNLERWTWHVLVTMVGGLVLVVGSIVSADLLTALLNLIAFQGKVWHSLSKEVFDIAMGNYSNLGNALGELLCSIWIYRALVILGIIVTPAIYIFGNSLKYKYNIIFTYIVMYVLSSVLFLGLLAIFCSIDINTGDMPMETFRRITNDTFLALIFIHSFVGALCLWGSYRQYCKAQISSIWNK